MVSDGTSLSDLVNRNDISTTYLLLSYLAYFSPQNLIDFVSNFNILSLFRYINRFQVNANEVRCDKELFVTYYKNHFVHVESFDGELEVEYVFTRKSNWTSFKKKF